MHLGIVMFAAYCGYLLSDVLLKGTLNISGVPVFLTAYVVGMIFKVILDATKASRFVEQKTISNISGTATDLLVACGVGAINLKVVTANALPLVVLLAIGVAVTLFMCFYFARHLYKKDWFEKAIFAWGW